MHRRPTGDARYAGVTAVSAIMLAGPNGPYANILAIRAADKDKLWVAKLVAAYHSPDVKRFIEAKFGGSVVAAW
jgi:D-methionine transport system substrate-binding protein